jgi:L-malate glycosyltransferase
MKILHTVESYLPSRHGMSEVVRQISERLVAQGHQVTVATRKDPDRIQKSIAGVNIIEFEISGNITNGIQGEYDRYIQFLLESNFDIVTNFAAQQWATDLALPLLSRIKGKKVFVPTGFSGLYLPEYRSYFSRMKVWLTEYDKVVYLSDDYRDVNYSRVLGLTNGILIPNGASEEEFLIEKDTTFKKRYGIPESDHLVLHLSGYVGGKGHLDAIRIFQKSKIKHASLLFVSPDFGLKFGETIRLSLKRINSFVKSIIKKDQGIELEKLKTIHCLQKVGFYKKIHFLELSREEVIQAYKNADLFLFPSHIECSPIVLFECMASKTPFLVTDVGNAKEIINWSGGGDIMPTYSLQEGYGLCHPDIALSAQKMRSLLLNYPIRDKMATSGYSAWKEKFTWKIIAEEYERLYREIK